MIINSTAPYLISFRLRALVCPLLSLLIDQSNHTPQTNCSKQSALLNCITMLTSHVSSARTAPRLSSKALKLVVASKSPRSAKSPKENKSADAKTKKKDSIPALAGNFQDRDEIELTILYRDAMPDTDVAEGSKKKQSSSSKKKKKNQSKGSASDGKRIVVYSTSNRKVGTDRSEGRDEMDSPRLPPGCT